MRKFDLFFSSAMELCSLGCLTDATQFLWIVLIELVLRLLYTSVKSLRIPAARCPAMQNPTVVHLSLLPLHFCQHPSSAFYLVVPQPSCAETRTLCRIFIPIQTYRIDIREDAGNSVQPLKKFLHGCRLVFPTDSCLWGSFFSTHFYFYLLVLVAQRMERFLVSVLPLVTAVPETMPLSQLSRFWRQNFLIEDSDLCSSSPSSTLDN